MPLRGLPQTIPVLTLKLDLGGFHHGLDALQFVRADDGQRAGGMGHDPGVGELIQGGTTVLGGKLGGLRKADFSASGAAHGLPWSAGLWMPLADKAAISRQGAGTGR